RYWKRGPYLGLGLGASSFTDEIRWKNPADLRRYLSGSFRKEEYQVLSKKEQMEEFIFLGFRMTEGVRIADFEDYFGEPFPPAYWDLVYGFENVKLMDLFEDERGIGLRLTKKGRDVSNTIFSEFLL
ncbi:MAG: coproporphyrinogen III oxidase, partial [Lachnospiraceae bacterium]|nr:coproporphyrinogen III oxidase [Lachnospiraceae bacterium]